MRTYHGSVLLIVMIMVPTIYMMSLWMTLINRQYLTNIDLTLSSIELEERLLTVVQRGLFSIDAKQYHDDGIGVSDDIVYQYESLDDHYGHVFERLTLWDINIGDIALIVDQLSLSLQSWNRIKNEKSIVYLQKIHKNGDDERLMVWQNTEDNLLEISHNLNPDNGTLLTEYFIEFDDAPEVTTLRLNNVQLSHNWTLKISDAYFGGLDIRGDAMFLQFEREKKKGLIAMYLDGSELLKNKIGVLLSRKVKDFEFIACPHRNKYWMINDFWKVGCRREKVVRYHFME